MRREAPQLNEFVFTSLVSAFSAPEWLDNGKTLHSIAAKNGLLAFVSVSNAIVTMYAKCGSLEGSSQMFESLNDKDSITWSAMITGFTQNGGFQNALNLFSKMHSADIPLTEHTLAGVINSCSDLAAVVDGKQDARKGFNLLPNPDIILWTSMISGYVQNGKDEEAFTLYCKMQTLGVFPNELTMASVLKACSSLAALEQGKQIHGCIVKYGFKFEPPIGSSLSTMYSKCGSIRDAGIVFKRMTERDVLSWNAMMSGLSHNGQGNQALELFQEMLLEGLTKPDDVTFVNIFSACSHMGLVEEAWQHFNTMVNEFAMVPTLDHYACMVDVLSRAGLLREATEFIESVPIDHGLGLWRILLSACRNYRSYELGAYAGEKLIELGSMESSTYVILSSIYNALGRRRDVERVRGVMKTRGATKDPGCSWIELKGVVHVFVVRDGMHPWVDEIRDGIRRLLKHMEDDEGYHPAFDFVLDQVG
ncbi:unnamed protein product [Linum tenue]|uniref:Pentatricopeptide repeat-containing protein n=1 Tax=Linum tenue TaxID=586396 RepID=A0AAV0HAH8_9ROSI|nr:unnamed protein product [Linum tenue]